MSGVFVGVRRVAMTINHPRHGPVPVKWIRVIPAGRSCTLKK